MAANSDSKMIIKGPERFGRRAWAGVLVALGLGVAAIILHGASAPATDVQNTAAITAISEIRRAPSQDIALRCVVPGNQDGSIRTAGGDPYLFYVFNREDGFAREPHDRC